MRKVVLIGLGAIGLTYAVKIWDKYKSCGKYDLFVLADRERIKKYQSQKPVFNGEEQNFKYILPSEKFDADIIFITTKSQGLEYAIKSIKNFVSDKTRIISLINGISSEEKIHKVYPNAKVLKSYFIGHSAVREENSVTQDGIGEIVIEHDEFTETFFEETEINYSISDNIEYSIWLKYTFNLFVNQVSAILNMNFGEMKNNKAFLNFAKKLISEVKQIAQQEKITNLDNLEKDALDSLNKMCDEGKTSMLQDILAKRATEVDIFAGEILRLGKKYNIKTPCNQILYDLIKIKEEQNEHSIHTC